jgi:hypothetical protein
MSANISEHPNTEDCTETGHPFAYPFRGSAVHLHSCRVGINGMLRYGNSTHF